MEAVEEELDLRQAEVHLYRDADKQDPVQRVAGIAALAIDALGGRKQARPFVVADGRGREVSACGEFSDFHFRAPSLESGDRVRREACRRK